MHLHFGVEICVFVIACLFGLGVGLIKCRMKMEKSGGEALLIRVEKFFRCGFVKGLTLAQKMYGTGSKAFTLTSNRAVKPTR